MKQLILLISALLLLSQCGEYKKLALGRDERIVTFCSDSIWPEIEDTLRSAVEYTIRTPQEEKIFFIGKTSPKDFESYRFSKNICLIASLDQNDESTKFIKKFISEEALILINNDQKYFFPIKNHLAQRQLFLMIVAPTKEKLIDYIAANRDRIYLTFDKAFIDRQNEQLYYKAEEKELSDELMEKYDFSFRLPNDFKIILEDKQRNVIQIGKSNPYRWITIYWRDKGFKSLLDKEWAWKTRSWIGNRIMQDTYIEKRYLTTRNMYWDDRFVNNLRGLWAHDKKAMGGPFSVFYFYDGVSDRIFFIDLSIWAPGEYKNVYLRQMELIASTFESRPIKSKNND
ncbi:MAG: DUF4837 family protein [Candidatus Marinimicrobia bacterium]|nr:DUF4837 family protein [Candidatus Neomarinimicrobiota bacterium]